jgi:hypothetical protein
MKEMELKQLLIKSKSEIDDLRRRNEVLSAKVEVMDLFACVLNTMPARGVGMGLSVDVSWELRTAIEAIEEKAKQDELAAACR